MRSEEEGEARVRLPSKIGKGASPCLDDRLARPRSAHPAARGGSEIAFLALLAVPSSEQTDRVGSSAGQPVGHAGRVGHRSRRSLFLAHFPQSAILDSFPVHFRSRRLSPASMQPAAAWRFEFKPPRFATAADCTMVALGCIHAGATRTASQNQHRQRDRGDRHDDLARPAALSCGALRRHASDAAMRPQAPAAPLGGLGVRVAADPPCRERCEIGNPTLARSQQQARRGTALVSGRGLGLGSTDVISRCMLCEAALQAPSARG